MKIIQFTAENIKKLKLVDISPTKDFIQITGANGSGKSSILDAIWWALGGTTDIQKQPIRHGEEKATIKLNLGEMTVIRRFTSAGTTLVVENADGFRAASPQKMLDAIIGHMTFDPLEFSRMDARKQFDALRHIAEVKIDLDALAKDDKDDMEKRRDINRDIKSLDGQIDGIIVPPDAPDQPVVIADLMKELNEIENQNAVLREEEIVHENNKLRHKQVMEELAELHKRIKELEKEALTLNDKVAAFGAVTYQSTDDVKARIAGAEAINKGYADKQRKATLTAQRDALQAKSDAHTESMKARESNRITAMQEAKMPIPGLSLGAGEVLFNDIPFAQLSAAEQLRVSVAIAMAANPKLRVIRIKDGSLLDDTSLKMIQQLAADKDYQVWCEQVDTSGKVGIVMEDGEIQAKNDVA